MESQQRSKIRTFSYIAIATLPTLLGSYAQLPFTNRPSRRAPEPQERAHFQSFPRQRGIGTSTCIHIHISIQISIELTERRPSRSFLTTQYPAIKKANPNTPILLREAAGTLPKVYARFGTFSNATFNQRSNSGRARNRLKDGDIVDYMLTDTMLPEFGNEKSQSLEGLTDKQIQDTVSGLVSKA